MPTSSKKRERVREENVERELRGGIANSIFPDVTSVGWECRRQKRKCAKSKKTKKSEKMTSAAG